MTRPQKLREKKNKLDEARTQHQQFMRPKPMLMERIIRLQDEYISLLRQEVESDEVTKMQQVIAIQERTIALLEADVEE